MSARKRRNQEHRFRVMRDGVWQMLTTKEFLDPAWTLKAHSRRKKGR